MKFYDDSGLKPELGIFQSFYSEFENTKNIKDAEIIIAGSEVTKIEPSEKLRYLVCNMTNTDHISVPEGVKVISLKGQYEFLEGVWSTAEHTLFLILSLLKKENRLGPPGSTLMNKTFGVIGHGRVGGQVESLLERFGTVLTYDPIYGDDLSDLHECLKADIITLHVSATPDMKPVIGMEELKAVRDGAYIINTSRPQVVDNDAIMTHLPRLGGFASDFTLPFWSDNTVTTNHTGGYTKEDLKQTADFCFHLLKEELCL